MLRVSGTAGVLRVGYQIAAELGAWELEQLPTLPRAYHFGARVLRVSDYWLGQTPLDLTLEVGPQRWTWRDVAPLLAADAGRVTLSLRQAPTVAQSVAVAPSKEAEDTWARSGR